MTQELIDPAEATGRSMTPEAMRELVDRHIAAESAKDVAGAVAVYTDDVEHDVVGSPTGPLQGTDGARQFYEMLTSNLTTADMTITREYYGDNSYVVEHQWSGTIDGEFMGVAGQGKSVSFRMLHVFEFRDGLISRENVWMDGGAIMAQLAA
jgi:steroid delta-isomerase-like uncharacterized protein